MKMERITDNTIRTKQQHDESVIAQMWNYCYAIENIEEELGISLITLFMALKEGAWFNIDGHIVDYYIDGVDLKYIYFYMPISNNKVRTNYIIKDYGKTWALRKEELENGKTNEICH